MPPIIHRSIGFIFNKTAFSYARLLHIWCRTQRSMAGDLKCVAPNDVQYSPKTRYKICLSKYS